MVLDDLYGKVPEVDVVYKDDYYVSGYCIKKWTNMIQWVNNYGLPTVMEQFHFIKQVRCYRDYKRLSDLIPFLKSFTHISSNFYKLYFYLFHKAKHPFGFLH